MKDKLVTPSYILIIAANFLQFFGFWLLIPILPFYLSESFGTDKATIETVYKDMKVTVKEIKK